MVNLEGREWGFVIGFSFVPLCTDEITKCFYRCTGFGVRPAAKLIGVAAREHAAKQKLGVTVVPNQPLLPANATNSAEVKSAAH